MTIPEHLLYVVKLRGDEILKRKARNWVEYPVQHNLNDARHLACLNAVFKMLKYEGKHVLDLDVDQMLGYWPGRVQNALVDEAIHILCNLIYQLGVAQQLQLV